MKSSKNLYVALWRAEDIIVLVEKNTGHKKLQNIKHHSSYYYKEREDIFIPWLLTLKPDIPVL